MAKTDKGTWRVTTKPGDAVTVQYELYANMLGERTRHIDDTHAYLDASGWPLASKALNRRTPLARFSML